MAKPAKPAAATKSDAPVADAPVPKNKKKLIIIVAAAVVALAAAGGGAWFFMKDKSADADAPKKVEVAKEPKFIPLETFTVNLQHEDSDQFLQLNIALKIFDPALEDKIKAVLPEIRSKLNLLLSSKRPSELATVAGKKKLAIEIATEANNVLGIHNAPEPVEAPAAASGVTGEAASAPAAEAVAEPVAEHAPETEKAEKKGVVDVLFTSFIIQ